VAFDFFPTPAGDGGLVAGPGRAGDVPGQLEGLEASVASIVRKIDKLPLRGSATA